MTEFPFQLLIVNHLADYKEENLTCTALLRAISGRRQVYDSLWNQRAVITKAFLDKISANRHLKREWRGMKLLQARGLNSPEPLFYGRTKDGHLAMVVEKITDSLTAFEVFERMKSEAEKLDMLVRICKELAKQHKKGVLQKDLHLGNFMIAGNKIFALDAGQMHFLRREVDRKRSISQLAMLACFLRDRDTQSISKLCREYASSRGWKLGESDEKLFQKQLGAQRKRGVRRGLKKCLRTSKRHLRIKADDYSAVFDKGFCKGAEPADFIKRIDALMDKGDIFKQGNTCYVSRIKWHDKDAVVKRYNHKGFIHSFRHTIKRSRARRGWLNGHRLIMLNIATPKPIAYIEKFRTGLVWQSYLVTEYVQGCKLYDFLRDDTITEQQWSEATEVIKKLIERLGKYYISHGDLKHTNILVTENGIVLTDLDAMKAHKWNWTCNIYRSRDFARLAKIERPADTNG
jgi:tRNA A-37 threonylcarbamoyl transferase component Bud32